MRDTSKAALAVGVTGFEPATTWSQTRCATGLRYAPFAPQSYAFFAKCARHNRTRRALQIKRASAKLRKVFEEFYFRGGKVEFFPRP